MLSKLTLQTRLTLVVSIVFSAAVILASVIGLRVVRAELYENARMNAETILQTSVDQTSTDLSSLGAAQARETTSFFFTDAGGHDVSELTYISKVLNEGPPVGEAVQPPSSATAGDQDHTDDVQVVMGDSELSIDPETGLYHNADGTILEVPGPEVMGGPRLVDRGADVIAVEQTVLFSDGTKMNIGVSVPLRSVTDSLDTIRRIVWFAVPSLILLVAAFTWLATSRALAPVHEISRRAQAISASSLAERVPVGRADDEVGELARTINQMLDRLDSSQKRQRRLVSDISHELRSPVAASRLQLEVAMVNPGAADWPTTAERVLGEQALLAGMIDDLLALSKLDEGDAIAGVDADLDDIVIAQARRPYPVAVDAQVGDVVRVVGDPSLLSRAVRNLVDNAARHAHSKVVVSLRDVDGWAVIDVDDDGPGIPEADRAHIFERFTRADEARDRRDGGAGLGLAIVRSTALAHEGDVAVGESPLGGARFTMTIPTHVDRDGRTDTDAPAATDVIEVG